MTLSLLTTLTAPQYRHGPPFPTLTYSTYLLLTYVRTYTRVRVRTYVLTYVLLLTYLPLTALLEGVAWRELRDFEGATREVRAAEASPYISLHLPCARCAPQRRGAQPPSPGKSQVGRS